MATELTRRDLLKLSGLGLGGLALGSTLSQCGNGSDSGTGEVDKSKLFYPGEPLAADEMRISFMGTSFLPRISQECNSIYVELGNQENFVFDFGSGVSAKYVAFGVPPSRMDKVFLTHLHGDHTSDLITLYCFGPSQDRKSPLYVWGPSAGDGPNDYPDEGTETFCANLRQLMKWHRNSFSFIKTGLKGDGDGYDIIAKDLPYMTVGGEAYNKNDVLITHFPAAHTRNGSISYKLQWNGLSMIFSGDTKPNKYMIEQAQGVDVLIHEMVVPPDVWAAKNSGIQKGQQGWDQALQMAQDVQDSSHTPQKALGYILSQTNPRLGIATHFQANDDTVGPAIADVRSWYQGPFTIATDLLVVNVSRNEIRQRVAVVPDRAWYPKPELFGPDQLKDALYPTPTFQLNQTLLDHCIDSSVYDPT
jgi:ribonuclease Z